MAQLLSPRHLLELEVDLVCLGLVGLLHFPLHLLELEVDLVGLVHFPLHLLELEVDLVEDSLVHSLRHKLDHLVDLVDPFHSHKPRHNHLVVDLENRFVTFSRIQINLDFTVNIIFPFYLVKCAVVN